MLVLGPAGAGVRVSRPSARKLHVVASSYAERLQAVGELRARDMMAAYDLEMQTLPKVCVVVAW
jgi:hypothetical protein